MTCRNNWMRFLIWTNWGSTTLGHANKQASKGFAPFFAVPRLKEVLLRRRSNTDLGTRAVSEAWSACGKTLESSNLCLCTRERGRPANLTSRLCPLEILSLRTRAALRRQYAMSAPNSRACSFTGNLSVPSQRIFLRTFRCSDCKDHNQHFLGLMGKRSASRKGCNLSRKRRKMSGSGHTASQLSA